ncbi:GtrA family protein [Neptuniibacter sp. CAU 1671]|uniref:GtrA family protein n=1 Tax=Neptuniibacter sp. CAU 1671 TaxID=3032593 RepID=UPI0023DB62F9|nr:GtrA family protein [Neptuniibacter sp. CAU 1671]MDF2182985.1 GtrA family protein [Neptuniibacter sp. CAU 1671]
MKLATSYALFALIAIAANILAQDISLRLYQGLGSVMLSILVGTAIGLALKYWLDKRFIFAFATQSLKHEGSTFMLYSLMGVLTTLIFWGTELAFEWIFQDQLMRYLGGVIGLTLGYLIKYQLDKRFVFVPLDQPRI